MRGTLNILPLALLMLLSLGSCWAVDKPLDTVILNQESTEPDSIPAPEEVPEEVPEELTVDSTASVTRDSLLPETDSTFKPIPSDRTIGDMGSRAMSKSPLTAMYWSAIPGGGQFYNEDYLKSALFFTSASVMAGFAIYNYQRFFPLQEQYDNNKAALALLPDDDPNRLSYETENSTLLNRKEVYRDNAHMSLFFLGISYFIATMDAYVGAHLYDFDVEDDVQAMLLPQPGGTMLLVSYRF